VHPLGDGELVDRQPVVASRLVEVDDLGLGAGDGAVWTFVFDGDPVDQQPVHCAVALDQRRDLRPPQLAKGILQGFRRQAGVKTGECQVQPALEDHLPAVGIGALSARFTDSKVRPV
jgi:hypothetical protein